MMRTLIKILPLILFSWAFAQQPPLPEDEMLPPLPPKEMKKAILSQMTETLQLSPQQVADIQAIDQSYETEEDAIEAEMQKLRERKREIRKAKKQEIDKILTSEQKEKLKEIRNQRKKRGPGGRH